MKKQIPGGVRKEVIRVEILVSLVFAVLLTFLLLFVASYQSLLKLRLEGEVEKSYNNVMQALGENIPASDIDSVMKSEKVLGFGYYTSLGSAVFTYLDAYQRLPVSSFPQEENFLSPDYEKKTMAYVRYTGRRITVSSKVLLSPKDSPLSFPYIVYILYDASSYFASLRFLFLVFALILVILASSYFYTMRIFKRNTEYKYQLLEQESLVKLGQAARTLNHEIKNPLSSITLQLALLRKEKDGMTSEDIDLIDHEVKRLVLLSERVSEFLKNPVGSPECLDLGEFLKELLPLFQGRAVYLGEEGSFRIFFDRDRLRSVVENLIKNALEASEDQSPVECRVSEKRHGKILLEVLDRGIGFRKEDHGKLFNPFYTTKAHGSGIGLSISEQFVKAAGGKLDLENREGGGTRAYVLLPRFSLLGEIV